MPYNPLPPLAEPVASATILSGSAGLTAISVLFCSFLVKLLRFSFWFRVKVKEMLSKIDCFGWKVKEMLRKINGLALDLE